MRSGGRRQFSGSLSGRGRWASFYAFLMVTVPVATPSE